MRGRDAGNPLENPAKGLNRIKMELFCDFCYRKAAAFNQFRGAFNFFLVQVVLQRHTGTGVKEPGKIAGTITEIPADGAHIVNIVNIVVHILDDPVNRAAHAISPAGGLGRISGNLPGTVQEAEDLKNIGIDHFFREIGAIIKFVDQFGKVEGHPQPVLHQRVFQRLPKKFNNR